MASQVPVNLRRILVLLVLVAALGTYLFVWEFPRAEQESRKQKLVDVAQDAVTGITLTYPDRVVALAKGEHGWRLTKPVDAPADEVMVKSLLATLTEAQVQRALEQPPPDLAPFGLDAPSVTAALTLRDGRQAPSIAVGKNTPIGGRSYVKKGDDPKVYLTTTSLQYTLNKQAKDLRDKTLLAFQDDDVRRVEIHPEDGAPVTLVRKDADAWTVEPGDRPADATEVRSYLSSLRATRAVDFPADAAADLGAYGLEQPRLAVRVVTGDDGKEASQRLLLGREAEVGSQKQVYAKVDGRDTVYALGEWSFRSLAKSAGQFRDKTILGFDPARVGRVELTRGDETATLVRGEGGWTLEGDGAAGTDTVTRLLDDLRDLRGADIAAEPPGDLRRFGLEPPALRVRLVDRDGQQMGVVLAGKQGAKYYAMPADGGTVFEVRDYMFTRLDKRRDDLVAKAAPAGGAVEDAPGEDEEDEEEAAPDVEDAG